MVFFSWLAPRLVKFTDDIFLVFIFLPLGVKFALTPSAVFYTLHNHTNSPLLYTHAHLCKTWREWHAYQPITASGMQTMRSRGGAYYINMTMATLSLSVSYLINALKLFYYICKCKCMLWITPVYNIYTFEPKIKVNIFYKII